MWPLPTGKIVEYLVVVIVVMLVIGFIYKKGGDAPRAELHALQEDVKAKAKAAKEKDDLKQSATNLMVGMLDKEAKDAKANAVAGWAAYNGLLKSGNRRSPGGTESVRTVAKVCVDPEADNRLSDAIQNYRTGVRAAVDQLQQGTGQLLESAGMQAVDLAEMKTWAVEQHKLNEAK